MPLQRVGSHLVANTTPQLSGQKTYKTSRLKSGTVEEYSEKSKTILRASDLGMSSTKKGRTRLSQELGSDMLRNIERGKVRS